MAEVFTEKQKVEWVKWLEGYGIRKFLDSFLRTSHGAQSKCSQCGEAIFLDLLEGGGVADWKDDRGDYGCHDSPDSGDDGVGGHLPVGVGGA